MVPETLSKLTPSITDAAVPSSQIGCFALSVMFAKVNRASSRSLIQPSQQMRMGYRPDVLSTLLN